MLENAILRRCNAPAFSHDQDPKRKSHLAFRGRPLEAFSLLRIPHCWVPIEARFGGRQLPLRCDPCPQGVCHAACSDEEMGAATRAPLICSASLGSLLSIVR